MLLIRLRTGGYGRCQFCSTAHRLRSRPDSVFLTDHSMALLVQMTRTSVNFLLDCLLLVVFVLLLFFSVVLRFVFPPASSAYGWLLWSATYEDWAQGQFLVVCLLAFGILIHVMLHWTWICGVISSRLTQWRARPIRIDEASRTIYGVGLLIVLVNIVGLSIAAAALMIQAPGS